jgi:hypothetical protein
MAKVARRQFLNTTQGHIGAVRITARGDEVGIGVAPGDVVWLSDDEVEATANAPQEARNNPFVEQDYVTYDVNTHEEVERGRRAPLVPVTQERFLPEEGVYSDGEDVGTPIGG